MHAGVALRLTCEVLGFELKGAFYGNTWGLGMEVTGFGVQGPRHLGLQDFGCGHRSFEIKPMLASKTRCRLKEKRFEGPKDPRVRNSGRILWWLHRGSLAV